MGFDPKKLLRNIRRFRRDHDNKPEYILLRVAREPTQTACYIAMTDIEKYLKAARLQIRRLEGCRRTIAVHAEKRRKEIKARDFSQKLNLGPMWRLFTEVHFYFICWDAIHSRIKLLRSKSGFGLISRVYKTHRDEFKRYSDARNHLEHYTERLPGGAHRLRVPGDLGNLHSDLYSLGGERWDVSRKSLRQLETIMRDLRKAIRAQVRATP